MLLQMLVDLRGIKARSKDALNEDLESLSETVVKVDRPVWLPEFLSVPKTIFQSSEQVQFANGNLIIRKSLADKVGITWDSRSPVMVDVCTVFPMITINVLPPGTKLARIVLNVENKIGAFAGIAESLAACLNIYRTDMVPLVVGKTATWSLYGVLDGNVSADRLRSLLSSVDGVRDIVCIDLGDD